jgi:replication factor A1
VTTSLALGTSGAKIGSWNTKSLTLWGDCQYEVNPDTPEAHELMGWWRQAGSSMQHQHISVAGGGGSGTGRDAPRIVFSDIEERAMGMNGTAEYFSVACFVTHIKTDQRTLWYIACPECKKKVPGSSEDNLEGHCEKCDKPVTGTRRWIFSGQCHDVSGSRYISFFDETATKLLDNKSADELAPLKEQNAVAFDGHFRRHSFQRVLMKCQVKSDTYNDEQRLKVSCQSFAPLNVIEEGSKLLQEIRLLMHA